MRLAINIANVYNVKLGLEWSLNDLVSAVLVAAMSIAGLIFLFMVIGGGIAMMSAGASGDPQKAGKGQAAATSGLIGFVVIFVAYWIVRILEIVTGVDFISNPPV